MQTNLEEIKFLLERSNVPAVDQESFLAVLSQANNDDLATVVGVFRERPEWMSKIIDNYKAKKVALATDDENLWETILKEEEAELDSMEAG